MNYNKKNMNLRYLSISQLHKVTGKDRITIAKKLESIKPFEEKGNAKIYDTYEALPLIFSGEQPKGMSKKLMDVTYEIEKEKLNKIRMDNELKIGRLVEIDEVVKTVEKEFTFVKAQIKTLPSKLSKRLSIENDPLVINQIITTEINDTLNELISDKTYEEKMKELEIIDDQRTKRITESTSANEKENTIASTDPEPS